jgi:hypothetical protein
MTDKPKRPHPLAAGLAAAAGAVLAAAALAPAALAEPRALAHPSGNGSPALPGPLVALPEQEAPTMRLLKTTPDVAPVGTPIVFSSGGLPPNTAVDVIWETANVRYLMDTPPESVDFWGREVSKIHVRLAAGRTDAQGNFELKTKVPEDYGALHDIYVVANGKRIAKGGFLITRHYTVSPRRGPVGTPITIKVTGLGAMPYHAAASLMWDNMFLGTVTSTTTRGSSTVQIRAAGPPGRHVIDFVPSGSGNPFLNIEQSAISWLGSKRVVFTTTRDNGPTKPSIAWPRKVTLPAAERHRLGVTTVAGVSAGLSSQSGPVLSRVTLRASGLKPGPVQLGWVTARGTRTGAGFQLGTLPLGSATAAANGSVDTTIQIPDDLGGWHAIELVQGGTVVATMPYYVDISIVSVSPRRVKAGQVVTVHLKGVGWTEIDNILAVTYNNGYVGYACGFFSAGDVKLRLVARGQPGTQLIDLWPTIYKQKGNDIWDGRWAFLSYRSDFPALALGYRIPHIRASFEIVK